MNLNDQYECTQVDEDDISARDEIYDGLTTFNNQTLGRVSEKVLLVVKNEAGKILGGLDAAMMPDSMYIAGLWLHDALRGQGFGKQLMGMAEQKAREHGCDNIIVDTYTFQAEPFYTKLGFERIAVVEKMLLGHDRIFLKKDLT